jgi:signal transduction histidine kinase
LKQEKTFSFPASRPSPIVLAAVYFFYATVILRTLAETGALASWLLVYLALEFLFGVLFTLVLWLPFRPGSWRHIYFSFQALLGVFLVVLHPHLDFTNVLLVMLSFQAALIFSGRIRWIWVAILLLLIILSLMIFLGLYGLALALLPTTVAIVFPAYVIVTQEIEAGQQKQQALLAELQQTNQRLTAYAGQVEELSGIHERNRLARELHDSVSQTMFSIGLHSRSARILLERDPDRLRPQLELLQLLTQNALAEMRSLIADLHPHENEAIQQPPSKDLDLPS